MVQTESETIDSFWFDNVSQQAELLEEERRTFAMELLFAQKHAKLTKGKLLDVGCGSGLLLEVAVSQGWDAHGLDIWPGFLEQAARIVRQDHLFLGTLDSVPIPDGTMDLITAIGVIEHVEKPEDFIRQLRRILAPRGHVLLLTPVLEGLFHRLNDWAVRLGGEKFVHPSLHPVGHRFLFSTFSLKVLLERYGFEVMATKRMMSSYRQLTMKERKNKKTIFTEVILPTAWAVSAVTQMGNHLLILARKVD
jgi:cyclopropane fatty-acyl-phospholipid synthase-like methyltransferase